MKRYALCVREIQGDKFPRARFIFQSENDEQAENEALKWAMYHGLNYRLDILVRPANQNELTMQIHNEYLNGHHGCRYGMPELPTITKQSLEIKKDGVFDD